MREFGFFVGNAVDINIVDCKTENIYLKLLDEARMLETDSIQNYEML